jgi:hypothetical protein
VLSQQAHSLCGFPQTQYWDRELLAVADADPRVGEVEFGERGLDVDRREVAGGRQLDSVVPHPVDQPRVRSHRRRGGIQVDEDRLLQCNAHHPA